MGWSLTHPPLHSRLEEGSEVSVTFKMCSTKLPHILFSSQWRDWICLASVFKRLRVSWDGAYSIQNFTCICFEHLWQHRSDLMKLRFDFDFPILFPAKVEEWWALDSIFLMACLGGANGTKGFLKWQRRTLYWFSVEQWGALRWLQNGERLTNYTFPRYGLKMGSASLA